jgi:uncharacterized repeat protein (TIGR01451 family)
MGAKHLRAAVAAVVVLLVFVVGAGSSSAASPAAGWTIESLATPTNFSPEENTGCVENLSGYPKCDAYVVTARNAGGAPTDGGGLTLTDQLPVGLTVQKISLYASSYEGGEEDLGRFLCSRSPVKCEYPGFLGGFLPGALEPDGTLKMIVYVTVEPNAPETLATNARISGGGAPGMEVESENTVSSTHAPFGASAFGFYIDGSDGRPDTQAGDHPYELTTTIALNNALRPNGTTSVQDVRDFVANLPLGFVGSTLAAPECTLAQLSAEGGCPADTIIGHIRTEPLGNNGINSPIYNLVPERGVPAEFGYIDGVKSSHVFYVHVVPTPAGYVLQTINPDIPQILMDHIVVTFYGDPAARDASNVCGSGSEPKETACREALISGQVPYFTNPTDCSGGELAATLYIDSWQHPARMNADGTPVDLEEPAWVKRESKSPPVTGCNALRFPAEMRAQPTTREADKPSGMNFEIKLPQSETVGVPATPTLKKVVVTLPGGFTVDPSAGDGLGACSEAQIGWLGGTHLNFDAAPPQCPEASKIGSLELETPLIPRRLEGEMFLARQNENPFGSTLAAYVVVHDPITGVLIKIPGEFLPDPHTGRLTAVFDENPNLPFSDLQLHFFGGPRAELATPESCGTFATGAELFPYSFEENEGERPSSAFDDFVIDEACPSGFAPTFTAGSLNLQAGAYTPFVASFSRSDTDQELAGLTVRLPPGVLANEDDVPECTDAEPASACLFSQTNRRQPCSGW